MNAMSWAGSPSEYAGALMNGTEELIAHACRGEDEAFRLIFQRHVRPILGFIYDIVGQRDLAEELTQETFVRAYRSLKALRDETKLSTWLFGIAKNVAREALRSRGKEEHKVDIDNEQVMELSDPKLLPEGQLLNKELSRVIHDALAMLDVDKRLVFTLKVFQHQSYQEIAKITGFSIPKLKTDLHRAKAEMRRRIRPYLEIYNEL
jgi:RNA polymerase sigma-70 factor (ECF subfamily)